jgi:membrane protease YdiL (CAAX protease family)
MESRVQVSADRSETPGAVDLQPRWPAWYAVVGFLVAMIAIFMAVAIMLAATGTTPGEETPAFTVSATLVQDALLVATALLFASFTHRPRAAHFGLRPTPLWPAVAWAALAVFVFIVASAVYALAVHPDIEQRITEDLGADRGTVGLIAAGFIVICVAPVAEEFFFRGFFYRALRTRFPVLAAALIDGALFGLIHVDPSDAQTLLILPQLGLLGLLFCLLYERTGSLYPSIALHAMNNAVAYASQAEGGAVSAVLGPLMLAACLLAPRLSMRAAPALR